MKEVFKNQWRLLGMVPASFGEKGNPLIAQKRLSDLFSNLNFRIRLKRIDDAIQLPFAVRSEISRSRKFENG